MKIEIYSQPTCPYCVSAKQLVTNRGLSYTEYVLGVDGITKETIVNRLNGVDVHTVPQIFIDDKHIGGYSELVKLWK